jgi:hypothetical protein
MTDATNGSAAIAGNPAGDQPAGNNGGDSTASTGMTGQAGASTGDIGKSDAASTGNWYDNIQDGDLKGYAQNKGWKDPVEVLNGYRNLEKLVGQDKIPMPKGAEDKEGWARVYDSLGRPKTAEEYKLPVPQGDSGEFAKAASAKFHELGVSQQQAEQLAAWWNEQQQSQMSGLQTQTAAKAEAEFGQLKQEWGQAYEENINLGQRAAREFGLDQGKLEALEGAWGTKGMLEFMAKIGRGLTEHSFEGGKTTQGFGMTPEAAKERISALRNDSEWSSKYMTGNADAQAELKRLMAVAYPE